VLSGKNTDERRRSISASRLDLRHHRAGGRYFTLVDSNLLFHLPQDRWPQAVDTDAVTRLPQPLWYLSSRADGWVGPVNAAAGHPSTWIETASSPFRPSATPTKRRCPAFKLMMLTR
jgi:hypothetical protein